MATLFVLVLLATLAGATVWAKSEYVASFTAAYPAAAGTKLASCSTCHTSTMALNSYGADLAAAGVNYKSVEGKDSDGDGATNLAEIQALTFPGDPASKPASGTSGGGSGGTSGSGSSAPASFRDIAGSPARASIEALVKAGVLTAGGNFRPNATITRAEFASMLLRLFGLPATNPYLAAFTDVPQGNWAYGIVEAAVRAGLMSPSGTGTFGPNAGVTRAVAAKAASTGLGHGADVASLSDADTLAYAVQLGLFAAGTTNSGATMTRGDAAVLVAKVLEAKGKMADPLAGITNYAVGPQRCETCHSDIGGKWQTTMHSRMVQEMKPGATNANFNDPAVTFKASDVKFVVGGVTQNYFVDKNFNYLPAGWDIEAKEWHSRNASPWLTSCGSCHTTGYDKGFKTFVALGITCESCHGPGAEHVATNGNTSYIKVSLDVDSCESCHGGDRQVGPLKSTVHYTVFADLIKLPYYKDSCMECHSATVRIDTEEGKTPPTLADFKTGSHQGDRVGITCVVCHDPHERTNEAQLRVEAQETCVQCHTGELATETFAAGKEVHHPQKEMWEGAGAIGVPKMPAAKTATCVDCHMTNGNHLFKVGTPTITLSVRGKPTDFDSCASCHTGMTADKIEGLMADFDKQIADLKALLAQVDQHISLWEDMGVDMQAARDLRDKAFTNISFAENDASKGIHNPGYVREMLRVAEQYLEDALTK